MKAASIEEYRHLLFTGEVPTGFKLEDDLSNRDYMWVIKKVELLTNWLTMRFGYVF